MGYSWLFRLDDRLFFGGGGGGGGGLRCGCVGCRWRGWLIRSYGSQITKLMGPTWGPSGADRTQVNPAIWVTTVTFEATRLEESTTRSFPPISPVPVISPHKGQWRGALMFSLICVWINGWVNNREAGDLRCHRGHYDVNVMRDKKTIDDWGKKYKNARNFKHGKLFMPCIDLPIGIDVGTEYE